MSSDKDILGVSTSLLTVLALAATSKLWVLGLPILLVVDAVEELRSQGDSLWTSCSELAHHQSVQSLNENMKAFMHHLLSFRPFHSKILGRNLKFAHSRLNFIKQALG